MKTELLPFRVSTGLKDIIGKDLIVDDFVAVFELVKNAFDAHAKAVQMTFNADLIEIRDDGKGMSHQDMIDKWLFVAYSAKKDGTEDDDYRDRIGERGRPFAGAKGVGRFSCDRLGQNLEIFTRAKGQPAQRLLIDWRSYERDPKGLFSDVDVSLTDSAVAKDGGEEGLTQGTRLRITSLRAHWPRQKLLQLKRELTKLIDPFGDAKSPFSITMVSEEEEQADREDEEWNDKRGDRPPRLTVNGRIENPIVTVLGTRTTAISVRLTDHGRFLESTLVDRGELIYRVREANEYPGLKETELHANIYFLNRGAKMTFAHAMGLPSVQFGSVFLFRNGFRVFPIGAEEDDFFGLGRRKQQGQRRFLGNRDLIGRVEIRGVNGFDEASNRNTGLIRTTEVEQLITCVRDKCVRRLERYVVDITWRDKLDILEDASRMHLDESSALIAQLVSRLAATDGVELLEYNPDLVRIVDEKSQAFGTSLKALELLAEKVGNPDLQARVSEAKARIQALEKAEAEAREAEQRAEQRAYVAENAAASAQALYEEERARSEFLVAAGSLDEDTILNLHHQIIMQAADVHHAVRRMTGRIRAKVHTSDEEWLNFLEGISFRNSHILTAARFATKGGYKQQSVDISADLQVYIQDYIHSVSALWTPRKVEVRVETDKREFKRKFRPIEIGILIDNLVTNAVKARATHILFHLASSRGVSPILTITVADDGIGWDNKLKPLSRVFEKGVTHTDGSGLGLFHVRQVVENLGGTIEAVAEPYSASLDGAQIQVRLPK